MKDYIFDPKDWVRIPRKAIKQLFGFTPRIDEGVLYNPNEPVWKDSFYFNAEDLDGIDGMANIPYANQQQMDELFARRSRRSKVVDQYE